MTRVQTRSDGPLQHDTIDALVKRVRIRRRVQGIAAALLPFEANGKIAVEAFQQHLRATQQVGLMNAVNMDTGYVNFLSDDERCNVLRWTRDALGKDVPFVAGAYVEGQEGDLVSLYRRELDTIVEFGAIPILFQTARLHDKSPQEKVATYRAVCQGYPQVFGFELSRRFAPNGEIFDDSTVRGLMDIPEMHGMKHSSLDRTVELERLALRDKLRPEFRIFTGNDLGINMIEFGSDYLLGLATLAPEKFAERDRLWESGDLLRAQIPTDLTHSNNPKRPPWEAEILPDCIRRLRPCITRP
jgi:dihydrodipicolinate synthase/N-acetylneuraminate lyase